MNDKTMLENIKAQEDGRQNNCRYNVFVCGGTGCDSVASQAVYEELCCELKRRKLEDEVNVFMTGCHGLCSQGPIMTVYPDGLTYAKVQPINMEEIVDEHFIHGRPVSRLLYVNMEFGPEGPAFKLLKDSTFYKLQNRKVMQNNGAISPKLIDTYIQKNGYFALCKALTEMTPEQVTDIVSESGLKGRGGGSFPTGQKWKLAAAEDADIKYVICNADEGDLGCYMDRAILEGNPHAIIEAMTIAAYAIGSSKGYIFTRPDYVVAVENLKEAIKQAKEYGMIGENIFGTEFSFDVELRLGAGAYVSGEETAILSGFDSSRSEPRPKQLYPVVKGLHAKPTVVNNVETLAYVPQIILGAGEVKADTKIFALGGAAAHTGLVEVPVGTTIRTLVNEIGGGAEFGKQTKAIVTGGASGSFIPQEKWDVELDYDAFQKEGFILGGGGITVLDNEGCIIDMTKNALRFSAKESCGKCTACRLGTAKMYEIVEKISEGTASMDDLAELEQLAAYVKENSLCGLGKGSVNPVISGLMYFRDEYLKHIVDKKCPAGVCKALVDYTVDEKMCEGCAVCAATCPAMCITERDDEIKVINNDKCVACGTCMEYCPVGAISKA